MPNRLTNKTALVTGSSRGLGRAIALLFAREGAHIICSDLTPDAPAASAKSPEAPTSTLATHEAITSTGGTAAFIACNVTSAPEVEALMRAAAAWAPSGRLDIVVNNAGALSRTVAPVWEVPVDEWDFAQGVNARGVFLGTKFASGVMVGQEEVEGGSRGVIVNVASVLGSRGLAGTAPYVASKHAVLGLTKTAALDCAKFGVRVCALSPGFTETEGLSRWLENPDTVERLNSKHPLKGLGTTEDVARAALFLASDDAAWMTGSSVEVDGGYSAM